MRLDAMSGTLYLVATPIGNMQDITLRALRVLREVDLVACEDTRHTAHLLAHHGITTPRQSFHEHNEASRTARMLDLLREGRNIALVSDAGTPLISDPGRRLVAACRDEGIAVVPVPGPSAVVTALAGSGLPTDSFLFAGFLPHKRAARKRALECLARHPETLVFYEAPHRAVESLQDMSEVLGDRQACLGRELTKMHEEWLRGSLSTISAELASRDRVLGEITVVVEGAAGAPPAENFPASIAEHLEREIGATGAVRMEALKSVARQRGLTRREAYRLLLAEK